MDFVTAVSTIVILNGAGNAVSQEHIPMANMKRCHEYARQVLGYNAIETNNVFILRTKLEVDANGGGATHYGTKTREIACVKVRG
jgi:hypothetical protein